MRTTRLRHRRAGSEVRDALSGVWKWGDRDVNRLPSARAINARISSVDDVCQCQKLAALRADAGCWPGEPLVRFRSARVMSMIVMASRTGMAMLSTAADPMTEATRIE